MDERTDDGKLAEFEARIARGEKIEPGDWMPDAYRKQLIRTISQHDNSEVGGMLPEGAWITRAPTPLSPPWRGRSLENGSKHFLSRLNLVT